MWMLKWWVRLKFVAYVEKLEEIWPIRAMGGQKQWSQDLLHKIKLALYYIQGPHKGQFLVTVFMNSVWQ